MEQPLYNTIGSVYGATRHADPAICRELAHLVGIRGDAAYLDLACGTGNYTRELAAIGGRWHGVDISGKMLRQASEKGGGVDWRLAGADALPHADGAFNGAICTLAIHHFPGLHAPFGEVFRVLAGGTFVIFTAFPEQMRNYWIGHYFPEMMERSLAQMPSREEVTDALRDAGFAIDAIVPFHVTNDLRDLFLYAGKERPELYLDPVVRANISSFATLCPEEELHAGLGALAADLSSGHFDRVAERYSSSLGDYAFVAARKHPV
jgi:SAM-dependent methyltransferase